MVQSNFRNDILQFKFNWLAILIFALAFCLFANATIIPDNTTIVGDLTVQSTNGIDINPGSDTTTDLISIGVTGSPKIKWNETQDAIQFIEKLILGTNAILSKTVNGSSYTSKMSLDTDTSTDSGGIDINIHGSSDPSYGVLSVLRSRGTHASEAIVQSGDLISSIVGLGYDGVDYEPAASIEMYSDGTPGSNDMPGRIDFKTVPDGSRTLTNVMRIGQRSDVMIGTTTSNSSAIFNVESTTKGSRPSPQMTTTQRDAIGTPVTGLSVYNTTLNSYDFYNGTSWLNLLDTSTFQEFSNKTVSGIFKFEESGGGSNYIGFQAPASVTSDVTFQWPDGDGTAGQALKTDGAGTLSWGNASGGSGAQNYIENPDAEVDTTGYAVYADAAGTSPVNGTGGSGTVTWTRSTSSPLRSTASFLLTKDAANRQGEGVSYDFSVDTADQAKVMQISFDYLVSSGTFVAGTSSTSSDVTVWIYDVTNSVLIQPSSFKLLSNSSTISDKFNATFQTASNSTSYRLIFHVGSTSASAYVLKFDSIAVSPSTYVYGTPITDWQDYTLTIGGSTTAPTLGTITTNKASWRQVGDSIEIMYKFYQSSPIGSGAAGSGTYLFPLPPGRSIDTSKISVNADVNLGATVGAVSGYSTGTSTVGGFVYAWNSTNLAIVMGDDTQALSTVGSTFMHLGQVEVVYKFTTASIPILGWSSSVQTSDQTDTRVVTARAYRSGNQSVSTAAETDIVFNATSFDDVNGFNTSTGVYTVQVPGKYRVKTSLYISSAASEVFTIAIYKTGAQVAQRFFTATNDAMIEVGDVINCVTGDTIKSTIDSTADTSYIIIGSSVANFTTIERISGPSAIAATESITVKAYDAAGTTINSSNNTKPFATEVYDSHGTFDSSTGIFTAPISGKYHFDVNHISSSTLAASDQWFMLAYKNASTIVAADVKAGTGAANTYNAVRVSGSIDLLAGETLQFNSYTGAATLTLTSTSGYNQLSIHRVGN